VEIQASSPEADKPTRALLTADVRRALGRPELRAVARQVLPTLLTEADTKRPRTVAEIRQETGLDRPFPLRQPDQPPGFAETPEALDARPFWLQRARASGG